VSCTAAPFGVVPSHVTDLDECRTQAPDDECVSTEHDYGNKDYAQSRSGCPTTERPDSLRKPTANLERSRPANTRKKTRTSSTPSRSGRRGEARRDLDRRRQHFSQTAPDLDGTPEMPTLLGSEEALLPDRRAQYGVIWRVYRGLRLMRSKCQGTSDTSGEARSTQSRQDGGPSSHRWHSGLTPEPRLAARDHYHPHQGVKRSNRRQGVSFRHVQMSRRCRADFSIV